MKKSDYDYTEVNSGLMILKMSGFIPSSKHEFALWYTINFYLTVVGFIVELFLLLPIFVNMMKEKSELDSFYLLFCISKIFDMMRFFLPADHGFSPSRLFSKESADVLRSIYLVYVVFIVMFTPGCQLILTINKFTSLVFPSKYKKVNSYSLKIFNHLSDLVKQKFSYNNSFFDNSLNYTHNTLCSAS